MKRLHLLWEKNFLFYELLLSVLIWGISLVWFRLEGEYALSGLLKNNLSAFYGTLASIFVTLLAFSIIARSIILVFISSEKFTIVREGKHYSELWNVFTSSIYFLVGGTVSSFVALVFDKDRSPHPCLFWIVIFFSIVSIFRIWRVIWILEKTIQISIARGIQ